MMPPLPRPMIHPDDWAGGYYTADQMIEYGQACADAERDRLESDCIAQERERCAKVCEHMDYFIPTGESDDYMFGKYIAAEEIAGKIRSGT